ncbi:MAG: UDP-N-acetylenolpyruvoylglucosamine reductase, partial [Candidatus Heimdallarchaeota archaeon]|nr:UDP-N-acetylenolpyruvoylglucosamine reductase [Candidatus Heimdallarchaeota archaeon]
LEYPSSGCMFKNIGEEQIKHLTTPKKIGAAGYLIDQAGLKGLKEGGAMISEKHANFIINTGGATSSDIKKLSDKIIQIIKEKYNITLEREVFFVGR